MTPQENFIAWLEQHYESLLDKHEGPDFRCRRCGAQVSYVTKHAAVRHGDNIEVMPVVSSNRELADAY